MVTNAHAEEQGRLRARVETDGTGNANVVTGLPVLDHLLGLLADHASFDVELEVAPSGGDAEVGSAGRAVGRALEGVLRTDGARGHGSAVLPVDEALAHVALEASGRPLVVSNVDLTDARVAGLGTDLVDRFLRELAQGAGLTLHLRLLHGDDTQHVLEAIFKALGVALAEACSPRPRKD